jgi:hypothetical protein
MDKYGDSTNAGRTEQAQISESAARPTQSSQAEGGWRPTGRQQITPAQEATLREMFGIQIRRLSVNECLEND